MTDAPKEPVVVATGEIGTALAGASMVMFGRADDGNSIAIAKEVSNELARLEPVLRSLTNAELSAYSTKSHPIGTMLVTKGHAFSVLTEDMLAAEFRRELDRRIVERPKRGFFSENWKWLVGILIGLAGIAAKVFAT